jgi:hypothetical protein
MGRARSTYGVNRNVCRVLAGNPDGRRPLGRPRRRWNGYIKLDNREIRWYGMDCIDLNEDIEQWRVLVNTVMNFQVP